ncbi:hypothetical protein CR513_21982, partial [Mucuna pruriens]
MSEFTLSLPDSYDQLIINITNNNIDGNLHFEDVAGAILEEESRQKNKEDRLESSKQEKALTMTRGRSMKCGSSDNQSHGRSKSRRRKNLKCYNCGMRRQLKKDCWHNKKNEGKKFKASISQGYVANTSDDRVILYSKVAVSSKGGKQLYDGWIYSLDSGFRCNLTHGSTLRLILHL